MIIVFCNLSEKTPLSPIVSSIGDIFWDKN